MRILISLRLTAGNLPSIAMSLSSGCIIGISNDKLFFKTFDGSQRRARLEAILASGTRKKCEIHGRSYFWRYVRENVHLGQYQQLSLLRGNDWNGRKCHLRLVSIPQVISKAYQQVCHVYKWPFVNYKLYSFWFHSNHSSLCSISMLYPLLYEPPGPPKSANLRTIEGPISS